MPTFRPIVSSIRTYNYELSKFLCSILQPCIPNEYTTADTFSFVSELKNIAASNKFMVSFDVTSLFTNIPLNESIDLAVSYILQNNSNLKLSKEDLTKLFSFATAQTHFLFNGSTYDQVGGVSMGSPLAPVLPNLFMGHHENIWLETFDNSKVLFYRRYVDDTFCLFNSEHDALSFFNFLNKQHLNITFSMEKEASNRLHSKHLAPIGIIIGYIITLILSTDACFLNGIIFVVRPLWSNQLPLYRLHHVICLFCN